MRIHRGKEHFPPATGSANGRICLRIGWQKQQKENSWGKEKCSALSVRHTLLSQLPLAAQFLFFHRMPRVERIALLGAGLSLLR